MLKSGKLDGIIGNDERNSWLEKKLWILQTILLNAKSFIKKANNDAIKSKDDLKGKK